MRRVWFAAVVTVLGSACFLLVRALVTDLLDPAWLLVGCAVGAFVSTFAVYDESRRGWLDHLGPGVVLVASTFTAIGLALALSGVLTRQIDGLTGVLAAIGSIWFFAVVFTSWWLVPAATTTLWALQRWWPNRVRSRDGV